MLIITKNTYLVGNNIFDIVTLTYSWSYQLQESEMREKRDANFS